MITAIARTKPMLRLTAVMALVGERGQWVPEMVLVDGRTGTGKSTALGNIVVQHGAVSVRANAALTFGSLLDVIGFELRLEARYRNADKLNAITSALKESRRALFIDEFDYLLRGDGRMTEVLRDIHDEAGVPIVLIGMEGIDRKLAKHPQFLRRISQRVEFRGLDIGDAELVAKTICEVEIAPDLLKLMHERTKGNIGLMTVALKRVEDFAKGNRLKRVDAAKWDNKTMFLGDDSKPNGGA